MRSCVCSGVLVLFLAVGIVVSTVAQNQTEGSTPPVKSQPSTTANQLQPTISNQLATDQGILGLLVNNTMEADRLSGGGPQPMSTYYNGMNYNGGWVIQGYPAGVYLIWYGNWSGHPALSIIPKFLNGLNTSPYANIFTPFYGRTGNATNQVALGGTALRLLFKRHPS